MNLFNLHQCWWGLTETQNSRKQLLSHFQTLGVSMQLVLAKCLSKQLDSNYFRLQRTYINCPLWIIDPSKDLSTILSFPSAKKGSSLNPWSRPLSSTLLNFVSREFARKRNLHLKSGGSLSHSLPAHVLRPGFELQFEFSQADKLKMVGALPQSPQTGCPGQWEVRLAEACWSATGRWPFQTSGGRSGPESEVGKTRS